MTAPSPRQDRRYSAPDAPATPWRDVADLLGRAELYWLTTVRADGRPHVTPLIGVWHDEAMHFTTGGEEQKHRNLEHSPKVALTMPNAAAIPAPTAKAELIHGALTRMGFRPAEAERAIASLGSRVESAPIGELVRDALAVLSK